MDPHLVAVRRVEAEEGVAVAVEEGAGARLGPLDGHEASAVCGEGKSLQHELLRALHVEAQVVDVLWGSELAQHVAQLHSWPLSQLASGGVDVVGVVGERAHDAGAGRAGIGGVDAEEGRVVLTVSDDSGHNSAAAMRQSPEVLFEGLDADPVPAIVALEGVGVAVLNCIESGEVDEEAVALEAEYPDHVEVLVRHTVPSAGLAIFGCSNENVYGLPHAARHRLVVMIR